MNLSCNCDMPIEIYADWLQDQGWEVDELRAEDTTVTTLIDMGMRRLYYTGDRYGYEDGAGFGYGTWFGEGCIDGTSYVLRTVAVDHTISSSPSGTTFDRWGVHYSNGDGTY